MARYIKRCMSCYYNLSDKNINNDNLCNLYKQIYENKNKFIDTKYLYLNNFQQCVSTPNKTGDIVVNYYDNNYNNNHNNNHNNNYNNNHNIGLTQYNIHTGEINMIIINREYRGKSLGKQIVTNIIQDMKVNKVKEVWVQAPHNHNFWSNVFNKSFTFRSPITSEKPVRGYFMKL
jgi:hypothetical protein